MVSPGDGGQQSVGRPGQPADAELRVLSANRAAAILELVEELVEHEHAEQRQQRHVAARQCVTALAVLVGEVNGRGCEGRTPHHAVAPVRGLASLDCAESEHGKRDAYAVERSRDEVFPAAAPTKHVVAERDQAMEAPA
jgi:hypothetical protein